MIRPLIDTLNTTGRLTALEYTHLLSFMNPDDEKYLRETARKKAISIFGNQVKMRGLIEISNYCKNNCYYCGIRNGNRYLARYRLDKQTILDCCAIGAEMGFQTFVLQGGEDTYHTSQWIKDLVQEIRITYPDKAITLSLGERTADEYRSWFNAGADRYLLRHETYDAKHYSKLHPSVMSFDNRIQCLHTLQKIGFETGTGIMVGSPYQTLDNIVNDLMFIQEFSPEMIGIGPFLHHKDTPFRDMSNGSMEMTLNLIAILRLMHPTANIPSTTSLGTIHHQGREIGILCGANVVMPNLSPQKDRIKYSLYDNKICTEEEAIEGLQGLRNKMTSIGYTLI